VAAIVSPSPSSAPSPAAARTRAPILAACRENLARYKVPARLVTLDGFPTTESPNGIKIQRAKLREMAERILREPAA
jgi:fatty-acyl-CoA synthase